MSRFHNTDEPQKDSLRTYIGYHWSFGPVLNCRHNCQSDMISLLPLRVKRSSPDFSNEVIDEMIPDAASRFRHRFRPLASMADGN